jgi:nucleobase:cation symporter-1, NCS1 family
VRVVERYGTEPVPAELRTVGGRDLFAIIFAFHLNPIMYVIGALAVVAGGLPLWWATLAVALGQALAFGLLVGVAHAGSEHGLPGQVALRATIGFWGARLLTSPYRVVAATYWFAAQALAGALGMQAILRGLGGWEVPLVPLAVGLAAFQAVLAALGFDILRYFVRVVLPLMLVFTGIVVALYLLSDDPAFAVSRVFRSPEQAFTWAGFAAFVTVMWGAALTNVTNIADFCRYARSTREMRAGFFLGAVGSAAVTAWVGGYAAVATGSTNPFVAVPDLTGSAVVLVLLLLAIVVQTGAVNVMNAYTAGLSLVNTVPRLGRVAATAAAGLAGVALAALPTVVEEAERWITHLGSVAAPLAGVIFADYVLLKRGRLDLPALYDPRGRYRYVRGVNPAAVVAVALAAAAYHLVPDALVKAAWGVGVGVVAHLLLSRLQASFSSALLAPLRPPPDGIATGVQQGRSQTHPR